MDENMFHESYDRMKLLGLELVKVSEAAALASAEWIGRGNKHEADQAATEIMRELLNSISFKGTVVIGEGELDEAPMLYIGEQLGKGRGPEVDIAVDPLEGTNLVANDQDNAISVIAVAPKGSLLHAPDMYMEKLAVGPGAAGHIDIDAPLIDNLRRVAHALGKNIEELTVAVQHRDRHKEWIEQIRSVGAKARLFDEGDVACSIATGLVGRGIDMFYSIGGAPEGVVSAVALKCLGGEMQARLKPTSEAERERCRAMGFADPERTLAMSDLVRSDDCIFVASGITDSLILRGVRSCREEGWKTQTMLAYGRDRQVLFMNSLQPAAKQAVFC